MPTPWQRDLEADTPKFEAWLRAQLPEARDLRMSPLVAPSSSGFSNETLLFDLSWDAGGRLREASLVVRIQPTGYQVFPEYDLGLQYRVMDLLKPTEVPVPEVLWLEEHDPSIFGAPFYVMSQVRGRVPTDNPPYHVDGWMKEISPAEREAIWLGGFDAMARIHRLDLDASGLGFLRRPELGQDGLAQELAYYRRFLDWAAGGRSQPVIEAAYEWLLKHRPAEQRDGLVWGDARIGNIIFDGTRPAAVLDWEMATVGSPEKDVAWAIFLDRHHSEGLETPRLPGFPSYEDSIAFYEERSGLRVEHIDYYQVFAGFRFSVIMLRIAQQLVHYGVMDEEQGRGMEINNTVTRLTAKLLDLPPPGELRQPGSYT